MRKRLTFMSNNHTLIPPSGICSTVSAVSPRCEEEELPDFLLRVPPVIERARSGEGSFNSLHLSPANISLVTGKFPCDLFKRIQFHLSTSNIHFLFRKEMLNNLIVLVQTRIW